MNANKYKELSIKEFSRAAEKYELKNAGIYELCKKDYPDILAELELEPFTDLLDAGCGPAPMISLLSEKYPERHYTGLDLTPAMIEQAKKKNIPNASFVVGDCENFPFADNSFDAIICSMSFHHYPHPQAFFDSVQRCLRPGGRLILRDMTSDNQFCIWFVDHVELPLANLLGKGDFKMATRKTVFTCAEAAGLVVERYEIRKGMRLHAVIRKNASRSEMKSCKGRNGRDKNDMYQFNDIGISRQLDWKRILHLFRIGLFGALLSFAGDILLGWGVEDEALTGLLRMISAYTGTSDTGIFAIALLGLFGITLEGLSYFGVYRLMAESSSKVAHTYRTGIFGYVIFGGCGFHVPVCALVFLIKHGVAAKLMSQYCSLFIAVPVAMFCLSLAILSATQIKAFAKGLTPYPKWCWVFSLPIGCAAILIVNVFGNQPWVNALNCAWLGFGNLWMFAGLLAMSKTLNVDI